MPCIEGEKGNLILPPTNKLLTNHTSSYNTTLMKKVYNIFFSKDDIFFLMLVLRGCIIHGSDRFSRSSSPFATNLFSNETLLGRRKNNLRTTSSQIDSETALPLSAPGTCYITPWEDPKKKKETKRQITLAVPDPKNCKERTELLVQIFFSTVP